ncbi:DUF6454 family protein [Acidimicrobiia bacterium EGI L10123]|uniref:DUF6454 family protein n=1 Tax=Salinilacustrithrix flava TaxID=2957203 RepID=UPI003D7C33D9|nr:DUF6454 family protein [Acidimicrobiia bacterium EGI L10123]
MTVHTRVLERLDRSTRWQLESSVEVQTDVGHPQGLMPWGEHWLVSTVHGDGRGELLVVDTDGAVQQRQDVTDGERFHPGGISSDRGRCWVPVAEYRPASTTTVICVDEELRTTARFGFDDHLGAVCDLPDDTLLAVSWGSRTIYRLDHEGAVLDQRTNPNLFVDHQDLTVIDATTVVATGLGAIAVPEGRVQLGGLTLLDVDTLAPSVEVPVQAWMPSGRVITYNGAHVDTPDVARIRCIVDDQAAAIATWVERR